MSVLPPAMRPLAKMLRHTPLHPQWLLGKNREIRRILSQIPGGTVLDVGCADRWIESVLRADCRYIALDYPKTGGEMYGSNPDVFADAANLPLADSSVGSVVMLEVLEHLHEPRAALEEASRVIAAGGSLLLTMPFLYPIHDAPHDYQRFTEFGLRREIEASGLRVEGVRATMGTAESAGLIACLAMAGMGLEAVRRRSLAVLLLPVLLTLIVLVNLGAWLLGKLLPRWAAVTAGYLVMARKP